MTSDPKATDKTPGKAPESPTESIEYILVAEDSPHNRNILTHLLKKMGFEVKEAADGEAAWELLEASHAKGDKIAAIFSDIMMPKMSGLQLLEKVRQSPNYKDVKFVLLTAVLEKEYVIQAKTNNVNGYLLKPITYDKMCKKMLEFYPNKIFPKLKA